MNARLGKGLNALLEDAPAAVAAAGVDVPTHSAQTLPVNVLEPSGFQPRHYFDEEQLAALAKSIKAQGVLQPLIVRAKPGAKGRYEIIAGERRWRASQQAGLTEVPAIILELEDGKALEVALVENVQRSDLNPIDEAAGYLRLVNEYNYTHEDMARVTGKSRSHITNLMRLLALPEKIKELVAKTELSMGHARALLALGNPDTQLKAAMRVMQNNLSVRETEVLVRKLVEEEQGSRAKRTRATKDMATRELETHLGKKLGLDVQIIKKDGAGLVKIAFADEQQLGSLLQRLGA